MPFLGDFLGELLAELSISRTHADAEALRIADVYARDSLLKHFPVPRFRLPTVTVRLPVAVTEMQEPSVGELNRGALSASDVRTGFWRAFEDQARRADLKVSKEVRDRIDTDVAAAMAEVGTRSTTRLASRVTNGALSAIRVSLTERTRPEAERFLALESQLREGVVAEFLRVRQPPPRLRVAVTAAEVKEAGSGIVNLELQISEDSVEWTLVNADDASSMRLVPE